MEEEGDRHQDYLKREIVFALRSIKGEGEGCGGEERLEDREH